MKKLILAFIALACAFAVSSCCDQSHCFGKQKNMDKEDDECRASNKGSRKCNQEEEAPYRCDKSNQPEKSSGRGCENAPERQHHRW